MSTKNIRKHVGTPYESRHARPEDGHRKDAPPPKPVTQPSNQETAEAAQARRNREGGIK